MRYLVTGASSGIGKRCAERLLHSGHTCILVGRNQKALEEMADSSVNALVRLCDLSDPTEIERLFMDNMFDTQINGFIHCAGIAPLKCVDENDYDTILKTYTTNVFSFLLFMKYLIQRDSFANNASVVSVSSVTASRGSNHQSVYAGSKAALEATTRCFAKELLPQNIRINTIVCGVVETSMLDKLRTESENLDQKIKAHSPLGPISTDRVCDMIEYMLSNRSENMTGVSIPLDGGYLL